MRYAFLIGILLIAVTASAQNPAEKAWKELEAKREALPSLHQEFEVQRIRRLSNQTDDVQRDIVVDFSLGRWRESVADGQTAIFDGHNLYVLERGVDEYVRVGHKGGDNSPEPDPYELFDADWTKASELASRPCGFSEKNRPCVILDIPLKPWVRVDAAGKYTRIVGGAFEVAMDSVTGMLVQSDLHQVYEYRSLASLSERDVFDETYTMKRASYGAPLAAALFELPGGLRKVGNLTRWDAARIRKQLAGKPAPRLELRDLDGDRITLAGLKGKTVLLDFWTTWCPPCVADAPALVKLNREYGDKGLAIIGIAVDQGRGTVEKFLKNHPRGYPIALTTQNDMPPAYRIHMYPTYVVIGPDGAVATAVDGEQGFGKLRGFLERAGMKGD